MDVQAAVAAFHEKYGYPDRRESGPVLPSLEETTWRLDLILEELQELRLALTQENLVEVADGLADLSYVIFGTAIVCGIDLNEVLEEVHRSNMTKDVGHSTKPVKGPNFEPPRIDEVLRHQLCQARRP